MVIHQVKHDLISVVKLMCCSAESGPVAVCVRAAAYVAVTAEANSPSGNQCGAVASAVVAELLVSWLAL
jgi:hypothetical protein